MTTLDLLLGIFSTSIILTFIINGRKYNYFEDYVMERGYFNIVLFWFKFVFLLCSLAYFINKIDFNFLTHKIF